MLWIDGCLLWQNSGILLIVLGKGLDISGYRPCVEFREIRSSLGSISRIQYLLFRKQKLGFLLIASGKGLTFQVTGRVKQSEYSYSLFMSCIAFRGRKPSLAKRVTLLELGWIEDLYSFFRVKIGTLLVTCHV